MQSGLKQHGNKHKLHIGQKAAQTTRRSQRYKYVMCGPPHWEALKATRIHSYPHVHTYAAVDTCTVPRNTLSTHTHTYTLLTLVRLHFGGLCIAYIQYSPTRSCRCTRLTDCSGWATQPAGDSNTSSVLPSCAYLLCSCHLWQLAEAKASCY